MNRSNIPLAPAFERARLVGLPDAAIHLAAHGFPVFPVVSGGKRPLAARGFHEATTDVDQIRRWWQRWPEANIGMPTGAASGYDVLDIDVRGGRDGHDALRQADRRFGLDGWVVRVQTPTGGAHLYFRSNTERPQRSWACTSAAVDFRGVGGYVLVPPSIGAGADGMPTPYVVTNARSDGGSIYAYGLRNFVDPQQARVRIATSLDRPAKTTTMPDRLAAWVASRPEGERNRGLHWAACRSAEAGYPLATTLEVLGPAALAAGLVEREIVATIRSAYRAVSPLFTPDAVERTFPVRQVGR